MRGREVDAKYRTHLAVNFRRNVERDQVKDYDREGGPARDQVDLWEGQIWTEEVQSKAIIAYPYRPPIGLTSSDETPLVVKTGDELPAVNWGDDFNTFTWYSRERC
jgi:hypothetical protein